MALMKKTTTYFGIEVLNAYHRVEGVRIVAKNKLQFQVRVSIDGLAPHFSDTEYECAYDLNGKNPIEQAYIFVKTLPEFENAIDC